MTHSPFWRMPVVAAMVFLALAGCKKTSEPAADNQIASLLFDVSSPAAREALATPVDFRLTDQNYAQWERAQRFLDALPRSAFASAAGGSGNPIDRAVATLEASPRARTSIERTGLSVRDFVLETIALAQATEAEAGKAAAGVNVPPENVQFIQRYRSRILLARSARPTPTEVSNDVDTTGVGVERPVDVAPEVEAGADARGSDSANAAERPRDERRSTLPADTVRDTIPTPIARF